MASRPGAAPGKLSFGDSAALLVRDLFKWRTKNAECRVPLRMKHHDLQVRTKQFALQVIQFCERLPEDETSRILRRQLLRAGTSVGANYRAVCRARSNADFINKLRVVEEECDESLFWMELLVDNNLVKAARLGALMKEGNELLAIVVASTKTARSSRGA